ncbi:MAG: glycoside hydrolase family 25 protein [bacterium]|nr:glycoside hydrolase family 25 protein [bacterium]MDY4100419.1 glycoside hydrolase family 25 protein [Lachnospiraceae bacterium]
MNKPEIIAKYMRCMALFMVLACGCGRKEQAAEISVVNSKPLSDDGCEIQQDHIPIDEYEILTENTKTDKSEVDHNDSDADGKPNTLRYVDAWGEWHTTTIHLEWKQHTYDWNCLKNDENGIVYEGDERYTIRKGIDVSYHQGAIDWEAVKNAGYEFAILRIAYRGYGQKGVLCTDSEFHNYIKGAQEVGLDVGVYIFSQAVNETEALEEADLVLENLKDYQIQLPVVYDPELIRDDVARTDDVSGEQFTKNTIIFCEKIAQAGYQPMIYSNMIWESEIFDLSQLQQYPIWYADYEERPQTPYAFEFWQYSEKGTVDGIQGNVDLDIQFVPLEE